MHYLINRNVFCTFHKGGRTHNGGVLNKCTHEKRKSLNGRVMEFLFHPRSCIMSPYDDETYCPLFNQVVISKPPDPSATKKRV